jgi:hypothetical protein
MLLGLTDRLAARTAFEGQLDVKPRPFKQPDNLFDWVDPSAVSGGRYADEA